VTVFDDNRRANRLSEDYRQGVTAAWPSGIDPPSTDFWDELEAAITTFISLQEHRGKRPTKGEFKRWQRIDRLVDRLVAELHIVQRDRHEPWSVFEFDSLWVNRARESLWGVKRKAEAGQIAYRRLGAAFKGRSNPYRAFLYDAVLNLWTLRLGQKLRYSTTPKGTPSGPLIRFFEACVKPVLDADTPTVHGIATIIDTRLKPRRLKPSA
jgi:hypothetical protein